MGACNGDCKGKGESSMGNVKRIYVEKKEPFAVKAKELQEEIGSYLDIDGVKGDSGLYPL